MQKCKRKGLSGVNPLQEFIPDNPFNISSSTPDWEQSGFQGNIFFLIFNY